LRGKRQKFREGNLIAQEQQHELVVKIGVEPQTHLPRAKSRAAPPSYFGQSFSLGLSGTHEVWGVGDVNNGVKTAVLQFLFFISMPVPPSLKAGGRQY
jgi:hypothetical protein